MLGDIPSGLRLLLHHFPLLRSRSVYKFVLEFMKDGLTDLGYEFTDRGVANQLVILQEGVGFSCCQVSQCYCQFKSNF